MSVADNAAGEAVDFANFESITELRNWLIQAADEQFGQLFGQQTSWWSSYGHPYDGFAFLPVVFRLASLDAQAISTAADFAVFSTTNVQVEGVDEADLVETDGDFIYLISENDLLVIEVGTDGDLQIASRLRLESKPVGMYLHGDRLALLSTSSPIGAPAVSWTGSFHVYDWPPSDPPPTTVTLLDVADRSAPKVVEQLELDGSLKDSRVVDGQLRLVVGNSFHLPTPIARPVDVEPGRSAPARKPIRSGEIVFQPISSMLIADYNPHYLNSTEYQYESREAYIERVIEEMISNLPEVRQLAADGQLVSTSPLVEVTDIHKPDQFLPNNLTTIATIDMHGSATGVVSKATVLSQGDVEVYSTQDTIFLFTDAARRRSPIGIQADVVHVGSIQTDIYKFSVDGESGAIELAARGSIDGRLLNQFAADEHEGFLRVVTQDSWASGDHQLFVLKQFGHKLRIVGDVGEMAPGEELHSVRFMGDRAFVVTFRKVDPLFAIDLSDPTNPVVAGELKIPGYSDYLQPIDEDHLLGIGRGADETRGLFEEMQVSIFDVSDLSDPQLVHRHSIKGGRTTASITTGDRWEEGDGDHHAVGYYPSEQLLAIPIFNAGETGWRNVSQIDNTPLFDPGEGGLQVLRVDPSGGIEETALIEHATLISRSLQIGESFYALSSGTVTVHDVTDPTIEMGRLDIAASETTVYAPWVQMEFETKPNPNAVAGVARIIATRSGFRDATLAVEGESADGKTESHSDSSDNRLGPRRRPHFATPRLPMAINANQLMSRDQAFSLSPASLASFTESISADLATDVAASWNAAANDGASSD